VTAFRPESTPADRWEAWTLLLTGVALLPIPALILVDRLDRGWMPIGVLGMFAGLALMALAVRALLGDPPTLRERDPGPRPEPPSLPMAVRLGDARNRAIAHGLRAGAMMAGLLLVFLELGPLRWAVLALFVVSFLADPLLLRPRRFVLDEAGLHGGSALARGFRFDDVERVLWRRYPPGRAPPWPGGDRLIVVLRDGPPLEYLFLPRHGGVTGDDLALALRPALGERPFSQLEPV
jgi:hypothetical protein